MTDLFKLLPSYTGEFNHNCQTPLNVYLISVTQPQAVNLS